MSDYEKTREERIKHNLNRMEKLGIFDLSLKPKSVKPIRNNNLFKGKGNKGSLDTLLPVRPSEPVRRSSRSKDGAKDSKLSVKKTAKGKVAADPNKPKRPSSAFFVFMEDFRKSYQEKHPENKSVAMVGKAAGNKWKGMPDAEKALFQAKAEKNKTEYYKNIEAYNKKIAEGPSDNDESDKSKSEVNDENDSEDQSGEDEGDDDE